MKRILRMVIALVLSLSVLVGGVALAESKTQNNVTLQLTTDQESYSAGDSVICTVNVLNANDQELTISYDVVLPEGLELATTNKGLIIVGAGEEATGSFAVQATGRGADGVPSTGDSFPVELMIALFVAALAVIVVIGMKKKQLMLFMLVFVTLFGIMQPALLARAEDVDPVTDVEGGFLPEVEEILPLEEDAFQTVFEEEMTEEEHEALLDREELEKLAAVKDADQMTTGEELGTCELSKFVYLDNQLVEIKVIAHIATSGDNLSDMRATLAAPVFKPITILGEKRFRLRWEAVEGATHYEVWHKYKGKFIKKTTTPSLTFFTNYGEKGKLNTYKVRAVIIKDGVVKAKSSYATRTAYGMAPVVPKTVKYTSKKNNYVTVSWGKGSFCTGYNIYRSYSGKAGTFKWIGKTTSLSFVDKYHNAYYKIRPYYIDKNNVTHPGPASTVMNMKNPFDIVTQPADAGARSGTKVKVSLKAMGAGLKYTWYYADAGKKTFSKSKLSTNTYSATMKEALDGRRVYCVVTDANGRKRTSKTVTISLLSDFTYTVSGKNCYITGYLGSKKALEIPAKIDGYTPVEISANAFKGNTTLTSITIPSTVKKIGNYAFLNCTKLKSVTLSNNVNTIGTGAFKNCTSLTTMTCK